MEIEIADILNNHRGLIFKVCNVYCSDAEDKKDLFQEIVYQVWKSRKSFQNRSSLSTWMYRIALNTAITHFKKARKENDRRFSLDNFDVPDIPADYGEDDLMQQLLQAIDNLDKIEKSLILLYLDNKSYDEISDITGLSKSNVGVRLNRIKGKLSFALKT